TYCVIPAEDVNARRGEWKIGPREEFFEALYKKYPDIKLIAEDLGDLVKSVHELRDRYNLPGMYVTQFTLFDLGAKSTDKQVVYPGTHDNQTLEGWHKSLSKEEKIFLKKRFPGEKDIVKAVFDYTWTAPSLMTIFPLQYLLRLGDKSRINSPGVVSSLNWTWKLKDMSWTKKIKLGQ
ncbi:MAG: 4-alpha-glucanotransferase, partial [Bacilli bacterium]